MKAIRLGMLAVVLLAGAAQALGSIGPAAKHARAALKEKVKDDDDSVRTRALETLKRIESDAGPAPGSNNCCPLASHRRPVRFPSLVPTQ